MKNNCKRKPKLFRGSRKPKKNLNASPYDKFKRPK